MPTGWTLVGFVGANPSASCFTGSAGSEVYEGPSGGSCTCGCMMTSQPNCPSGPIGTLYDQQGCTMGGACSTMGNPAQMQNMGNCATDLYQYDPNLCFNACQCPKYNQVDSEFVPPAATGGSCMTSATASTGGVTYADHDTLCTPSSSLCTPNTPCMPGLPSQFDVCIAQSGNQACPGAPFTHKHLVGGAATFGCSTGCGCTLPANPPCTGTMKLYTDTMCTNMEYDIAASSAGMCVNHGGGEQDNYQSYHYVADQPAPVSCSPSGTSSVQNLALSNEQTLCCTQ